MFVVDTSSTGAEILFLIELSGFGVLPDVLVVLLRETRPSAASRRSRLCFTLRVVKALVMDML